MVTERINVRRSGWTSRRSQREYISSRVEMRIVENRWKRFLGNQLRHVKAQCRRVVTLSEDWSMMFSSISTGKEKGIELLMATTSMTAAAVKIRVYCNKEGMFSLGIQAAWPHVYHEAASDARSKYQCLLWELKDTIMITNGTSTDTGLAKFTW